MGAHMAKHLVLPIVFHTFAPLILGRHGVTTS